MKNFAIENVGEPRFFHAVLINMFAKQLYRAAAVTEPASKKQKHTQEPSRVEKLSLLREKLEELLLEGTIVYETGGENHPRWAPYILARGRSASSGLFVTDELREMMTIRNKRGQSLMFVVFRFGNESVIQTFFSAFSVSQELKTVMGDALVIQNTNKDPKSKAPRDFPLGGYLFREKNLPTISDILEKAAECMKFTQNRTAIQPLSILIAGGGNVSDND